MDSLAGKRVTVAGLGRFGGGIAAARWLCQQGANVLVTDKDSPEKLADSVKQLVGLPIEFQLGGHRDQDFINTDLIVASPALAPQNNYLQTARAAGVPITTEIRLFIERCPAKILGVTGTKGKSTCAAMLNKILSAQFHAWIGGNIGRSLLPELPNITTGDLVILELSSFMLEHLRESRWSPHVAVVTMISADHLEWHGSAEAYLDAKKNILRFQGPHDYAVLNEQDPGSAGFAREAPGKIIFFGTRNRKRFDLHVPGEHNQLNAQAAFTAAAIFGVDFSQAQSALADFHGLPHRLQLVADSNSIRWFNDSIATIPDAAIAALQSFPPRKVIQIVGGYDKKLPITSLCAALIDRAKAVLCIGATGEKIAELIEQSPRESTAPAYRCHDLPTAATIARKIAAPGDVILLSPGFASYDQYINFEHRGEEFAGLAKG